MAYLQLVFSEMLGNEAIELPAPIRLSCQINKSSCFHEYRVTYLPAGYLGGSLILVDMFPW